MNNKNKYLSYGSYILSLILFGTNGIYVANISLRGSQIVLLRSLIGGILLTVLILLKGGFNKKNIKKEFILLLLGGIALGLNWIALFEAYKILNVSLATLIYYVGPIIVLLFSPILFKEKLTKNKIISIVLVAIGLICITGSIVIKGMNIIGLLVAILSALLYAGLIVFNKHIVSTSGIQTAAIELDIAFAIVFIYSLFTTGLPVIIGRDLPYILGIGIINTGLAYCLYFTGLQKLSGQSVALISYLDPVSTLVLSAIFLHESMTPVQIIGAVLIIGGAIFGEKRKTNGIYN